MVASSAKRLVMRAHKFSTIMTRLKPGVRSAAGELMATHLDENKVLHGIGDLAATDLHGLNRNDMLVKAKIYFDRLLRPNKDVVLPLS